ncbi:Lysophospholipase L1 [Candidatus Electronema halotolerans]
MRGFAWRSIWAVLLWLVISAGASQAADTVVCFGDSITAGYKSGSASAYPTYLQPMLDANTFVVVNAGKGGEDTYSGVSRFASVLATYQPKYVIIMEGANDVVERISSSATSFNVASMAKQAKDAGATPIMSTITPNIDDSFTPENYNPEIIQAAADNGVTLVDTYSRVAADWPSLNFDGMHPNSDGAYIIAEGFAQQLVDTRNSQEGGGGGGSSGCFIATAAFGTALEHHVILLKRFRDLYLLTNAPGKAFVKFYYTYSPSIAAFIARHDAARLAVRTALLPFLGAAWVLVQATPAQQAAVLIMAYCLLLAAVWLRRRKKCLAQ